jgi:predicted MFS family arabinose efflux permease
MGLRKLACNYRSASRPTAWGGRLSSHSVSCSSLAHSIYGVILGRSLQGAGAVSAAVTALVADLTSETQRTKAMAVIGITIGASFLIAIPLGSALNTAIGVPGIFWFTAILAIASLAILWLQVPTPEAPRTPPSRLLPQLTTVLRNGRLLRLNAGIFALHAALTAVFVVLPHALVDGGLPARWHPALYLPLMAASALPLFPLISWSERRGRQGETFAAAVLVLSVALSSLSAAHSSILPIASALLAFFVAFNILEASLPSLVSKRAPAQARGMAIGIYSTFQFLGAFVGGDLGGWLYGRYGVAAVFAGAAVVAALWFLLCLRDFLITSAPMERA